MKKFHKVPEPRGPLAEDAKIVPLDLGPLNPSLYPPDWPRCVSCGDYALDGHLTCGRAECDESGARNR